MNHWSYSYSLLIVKRFILFSLFICCATFSSAQEENYDVVFYDHVYYDHLKSVSFHHSGLVTTLPIIDLGRTGTLVLSFDDMEGGSNLYTYEIIHCTKDWERSELDKIEYLDGFDDEDLEDFEFSAGTIYDYTHYTLSLPNDDIIWTISGNYLLVIYEGDDDDKIPVITRRFMVVEPMINISGSIESSFAVSKLKTHHRINLVAFVDETVNITNPVSELEAVIFQNGRWDNAIYNIPPQFQARNEIQWNRADAITMPALKEFRNFDIRSFNYTSQFVHSIELEKNSNTVLLELGEKRTHRNFISDFDANGKFVLDNQDRPNQEVTGDYAQVIFSLDSENIFEKDVYIIGSFSDWQLREEYKLEYDQDREIYIGKALFKQGYYDYMYVTLDRDGNISSTDLEGSWFETENSYTVLLYYSEFGSRYDRLIASTSFSSNR